MHRRLARNPTARGLTMIRIGRPRVIGLQVLEGSACHHTLSVGRRENSDWSRSAVSQLPASNAVDGRPHASWAALMSNQKAGSDLQDTGKRPPGIFMDGADATKRPCPWDADRLRQITL
jgi:hypothetical protein